MSTVERTRRCGRRTMGIVVLLAALAGTTVAARPADAATSPTGKVLAKPCLDVRSGPHSTASGLGCVPYNTTVTIQCTEIGQSLRGPYGVSQIWDRVVYKGATGYLPDAFVLTGTNGPVAAPCFGPGKGRIAQSGCLRMRTSPALNAPWNRCIPYYTLITIACTKQGETVNGPWAPSKVWDRTTYEGATGFVPDARVYTATANPIAKPC